MRHFYIKFFLFFFAFIFGKISAQEYKNGLSDGMLNADSNEIPVKIFATTSPQTFVEFASIPATDNTLIILNDVVEGYAQTNVFSDYENAGYQLLDKDFRPINNKVDTEQMAYFYRPKDKNAEISQATSVKLETEFSIWNPSKGINIFGFTLHFYSLMFVLAFGLGYFIMSKIYKIDGVDEKLIEPLLTWTIVGTIFGARIGHVVFYQSELFHQDFWSVFLPIQTKPEFKFTGFSGLASHGATIALIFTTLYYSFKIIKRNPFWVYDRLGIVVALGGAFVRIGNFFNSEIIGKPVSETSPFAILFPQMSDEYGVTIPRYPTQLFEAFGYVLLFVLLWFLYRYTKKKYQQGWLFGLFFVILWSIRFFVEFFKEPQGDEYIQFMGLNTGQVLSLPFIIAGILIMIYSKNWKIEEKTH